jgi:hypothetical protein
MPKILPFSYLILPRSSIELLLLPSLSSLPSCVPLCASFRFSVSFVHIPLSLSFIHFCCLRFLHPIFLPRPGLLLCYLFHLSFSFPFHRLCRFLFHFSFFLLLEVFVALDIVTLFIYFPEIVRLLFFYSLLCFFPPLFQSRLSRSLYPL